MIPFQRSRVAHLQMGISSHISDPQLFLLLQVPVQVPLAEDLTWGEQNQIKDSMEDGENETEIKEKAWGHQANNLFLFLLTLGSKQTLTLYGHF